MVAARARPTALVAAVACLLVYGVNFAHLALVRHAPCVAHDEVVHAAADAAAGPAGARRPDEEAPPGTATTAVAAASIPGHGEEHCLALASRRREHAALSPAQADGGPAPGATPLPRPAPREAAAAPIPLVRLAPKTSPPRPALALGARGLSNVPRG
jgi:hypothetical protein